MSKRAFILLATLAVGVSAAGAAAEPPWSIEGRGVGADNCAVGCPCILGEPPTHGHCHFVAVVHIDRGHFGDVRLEGVNLGFAGRFVKPSREEPEEFQLVAYYPDAKASAAQRQALRLLLTETEFFAGLGEPAELEEMAIRVTGLDSFAQVGKSVVATIGDIARIQVTPIGGSTDPDRPMVADNPADPIAYWVAFGTSSDSHYRGAGQSYAFEGTSGESFKVRWSGSS